MQVVFRIGQDTEWTLVYFPANDNQFLTDAAIDLKPGVTSTAGKIIFRGAMSARYPNGTFQSWLLGIVTWRPQEAGRSDELFRARGSIKFFIPGDPGRQFRMNYNGIVVPSDLILQIGTLQLVSNNPTRLIPYQELMATREAIRYALETIRWWMLRETRPYIFYTLLSMLLPRD